jgi:acyl carrier protein
MTMKKQDIEKFVINTIAETLYITEEEVEVNLSLSEELGVDSLEMYDIFIKIANEYKIPFNLKKITSSITGILEKMETSNPIDILNAVGKEIGLEFSEENSLDFKSQSFQVNKGLLIKKVLSYITINMLVSGIERLIEEGIKDA